MALITPIFNLPHYSVDRLADSDGQSRKREKKQEQEDSTPATGEPTPNPTESETPQKRSSQTASLDTCQQLDTETTIKLLDEQVKRVGSNDSPYETVKNLTSSSKLDREV